MMAHIPDMTDTDIGTPLAFANVSFSNLSTVCEFVEGLDTTLSVDCLGKFTLKLTRSNPLISATFPFAGVITFSQIKLHAIGPCEIILEMCSGVDSILTRQRSYPSVVVPVSVN